MVILDTNIIIDHLRSGDDRETALMKIAREFSREELAISVITVQELYEGQSTREKRKEEHLLATIAPLLVLPYTYDIAESAGKIARDIKRPIELADAAIAATALANNAHFATLNKKDFLGIFGLQII